MKENQWEVEYKALMDELQEMREMLEEERQWQDEVWKMLMEDDWK